MKKRPTVPLTHSMLLSILNYDPETGQFTWSENVETILPPVRVRGSGRKSQRVNGAPVQLSRHPMGYSQLWIHADYGVFLTHRLAFFYMTGRMPPKKIQIDHENGRKTDNHYENLRLATPSQNSHNVIRPRRKLPVGVQSKPNSNRYGAISYIEGERHWLGTYDTPEEAHSVYLAFVKDRFGQFADRL